MATIERDLHELATVYRATELRLTGGEPLIHPDLLAAVRVSRESGIAEKLTLITNGVLLHKAPDALWELIDRLWVTIYPGITYRFDEEELQAKCRDHDVRYWMRNTSSFQLSLLNQRIPDRLVRFIYRSCSYAHNFGCRMVHEGRFYKCSPVAFMEQRLALRGVEFHNKEQDGVALHDNPNLRMELEEYLADRKTPLAGCAYCLGSVGHSVGCHQLDADGLSAEHAERYERTSPLFSARAIGRTFRSSLVRRSGLVEFLENRFWDGRGRGEKETHHARAGDRGTKSQRSVP